MQRYNPAVRLAWFLALRLLQRRGTALLRTSALASVAAVALGAASLIIVLALMTGYRVALRDGVLSAAGHVVAMFPESVGPGDRAAARAAVAAVRGVVDVRETLFMPGLLFGRPEEGGEAITVRAGGVAVRWGAPPPAVPGAPLPALIGAGLARRLRLVRGETAALQLVAGGQPKAMTLVVADVVSSGVAEIDDRWAMVDLAALRSRLGGLPHGSLEIRLAEPENASELLAAIRAACPPPTSVTSWQQLRPELVGALRWQKLSLALVLSLVLGVGAFEVSSALVVLFTEKRREFGVLLAVGGSPALIRRTLVIAGGVVGGVGVVGGIVIGLVLAGVMTAFGLPRFSPEVAAVYMVDHIPMKVLAGDMATVLVLGLVEVVLASLIPARAAARREPVEVLRWT